MVDVLISLDGSIVSPRVFRSFEPVDSQAEEYVGLDGGVLSFLCMKEVSVARQVL